MARKFFIAAGHGAQDPGSTYHGLYERDGVITIVERVFQLLQGQNTNGVEMIKVPHELDLQGEINWINKNSSGINDWCVDVHLDVAKDQNLRGSLIIVGNNDLGRSLGQPFVDELAAKTGVKSRGFMWNESKKFTNASGQVVQVGFGFVNFTKPLAAIVEVDFITCPTVAEGIKNNTLVDAFAKGLVSAILKVVGSSYKEPQPTPPAPAIPPSDDLYRVTFKGEQLGAYRNNPIQRISELENKLNEVQELLKKKEEHIAHLSEEVRLKDGEIQRVNGVLTDTQKALQTSQDALKQCRIEKGDSVLISKILDAIRRFLEQLKEVKPNDEIHK